MGKKVRIMKHHSRIWGSNLYSRHNYPLGDLCTTWQSL